MLLPLDWKELHSSGRLIDSDLFKRIGVMDSADDVASDKTCFCWFLSQVVNLRKRSARKEIQWIPKIKLLDAGASASFGKLSCL